MRRALDLSNYTTGVAGYGAPGGVITLDLVKAWQAAGYSHVMVGTQWPELAKHQLEVCLTGGMTADVYSWLSWARDLDAYIKARLEFHALFPVGRHWLDAEEDAAGRTPDEIVRLITVGVNALGGFPTGIYTGRWWWEPATASSSAFAHLPLWLADYREQEPSFDAFVPFGGWTRPRMWQWKSGASICAGDNLDLNLLDDAAMPAAQEDLMQRAYANADRFNIYRERERVANPDLDGVALSGRQLLNVLSDLALPSVPKMVRLEVFKTGAGYLGIGDGNGGAYAGSLDNGELHDVVDVAPDADGNLTLDCEPLILFRELRLVGVWW